MSPIAFSIFLLTAVTMVTVVQGACQAGVNFTTTTALYNNIDECALPADQLNATCVSASCPSLSSGTCPLNPDGSINTDSFRTLINTCLSSMTSVCGVSWNPVKVAQMGLTLPIPGGLISATCYSPAGGVTARNFQKTSIVSMSSSGPSALSISLSSPNAVGSTDLTCNISGIAYLFNGTMTRAYKGSATITLGSAAPTVSQVSTTGSSMTVNVVQQPASGGVGGLVQGVVSLSTTVLTALVNLISSVATASTDDVALIKFVATYVGLAFQVLKCPSG